MSRKFDIGTAGGLFLGFLTIFGSFILEGGKVGALILLPAMMIVFGGTFAAAMIGTSLRNVTALFRLVRLALLPPNYNFSGTIDEVVRFATVARRDGLLALEKQADSSKDAYLKRILRFTIDGTEPEALRSIIESEVHHIGERHMQGVAIFQKMGGYSPTMGIIGTVMGLIATLASAGDDPNELIHHIASAFIATLWGVFMANIVWLPLADKLKFIHAEESLFMEMISEGVISIQAGEVPSVVRAKLESMLPIYATRKKS
ncbi:MAG TPA: flagellar motor protein [Bacteroidota bacterium]|nr:flagellar motor protein [Bacteroidota bacterium]